MPDPRLQSQDIGKAMYEFALLDLKVRGAEIAYVGTGGDPANQPARSAYEAVGFNKAIPGPPSPKAAAWQSSHRPACQVVAPQVRRLVEPGGIEPPTS
jgi:GNAT superfamily N-acetyltransferase